MIITDDNKRALQMMKLTTELVEQNERLRLAVLEARPYVDYGTKFNMALNGEPADDVLRRLDAAVKS